MTKFFLENFYIMGYNLKHAWKLWKEYIENIKTAKFEPPVMKE